MVICEMNNKMNFFLSFLENVEAKILYDGSSVFVGPQHNSFLIKLNITKEAILL